MANPRQIAYQALLKIEKDAAFSNLALDAVLSKSQLDTRDKSFVSNLFYGVIERQITLDYNLSLYLSKPIKKLKSDVLTIMRMGAYQILFMDKVPNSAAVNESIKLAKKGSASYSAGLINAVLRKVCDNGLALPSEDNLDEFVSVKYSCPLWLTKKLINEYGKEDAIAFLEASLSPSKVFIKVNNTKIDEGALIEKLKSEGVMAEKTYNENTLVIHLQGKDVSQLNSFKMGLFHVQDMASQLCARAVDPKENDVVFDLCSAPGGKAYSICEMMNNKGRVLCFDIYENRVSLIMNGAKRLGLTSIEGAVSDATVFNGTIGLADKVLCDVPCSGLGIITRKPEIKYKKEQELLDLPDIQLSIINNGARYLKIGGRLVYSTCTLSKAENENVCEKFLKAHTNFKAVGVFSDDDECMKTLMPHKNESDGFFIACFKREE